MEFKRRRELKRTKIEIIPMIDTIFFLLVFFMLSSLALAKLNGLPVDLPKAATSVQQPRSELTITIDSKRQIFVNNAPVSPDNVGRTLLMDAGVNANLSNESVVINADQNVPEGLVVGCIDVCREVGINNFSIATNPEEQSAVH